jgi:hypothetical protein
MIKGGTRFPVNMAQVFPYPHPLSGQADGEAGVAVPGR